MRMSSLCVCVRSLQVFQFLSTIKLHVAFALKMNGCHLARPKHKLDSLKPHAKKKKTKVNGIKSSYCVFILKTASVKKKKDGYAVHHCVSSSNPFM